MVSTSITSTVLFESLCNDLDLHPEPTGSRFDPFPDGIPCDSELGNLRARYALLCSAFKKSEVESSDTAESDTFRSFVEANNACEQMDFDSFSARVDGNPLVGYVINGARQLLYNAFFAHGDPVVTMGSIESKARFGPGRSVGLKEKPSLLYFKVGDSDQTAGSEFVRSWYEISVLHNPLCEAAEMARKARHGRARVVTYGNLTFVPKSYSKRRIVITEPSLSTYFQLGLGEVMGDVLETSFRIDLSTQAEKNSELARIGSITGRYATADLTQCSDYISCWLVKYMFPPSVVRWVEILRTKEVRHRVDACGEATSPIRLHMCSTMGNGFTFPLQTLLLSALVKSTLETLEIDDDWGVFGDDICLPTEAFDLLCKVLHACGLRVNQDKSFSRGLFRESCGTDWYDGVDVRGVYLKDYTSDQDLFSCYNRLALWSAIHDVPLTGTLASILAMCTGIAPIIPPDEDETAGIRVPMPVNLPDESGVWDYAVWEPELSSFSTEPWQYITVGEASGLKPKSFARWVNDLKKFCDGSFNEPALLKVLLAGGLRRSTLVFRKKSRVRYRLRRKTTPRWGWTTEERWPIDESSDCFKRLQSVIEASFQRVQDLVL